MERSVGKMTLQEGQHEEQEVMLRRRSRGGGQQLHGVTEHL